MPEAQSESPKDPAEKLIHSTGKAVLIGIMGTTFFYLAVRGSEWCFLDYVNLPFHEAGHLLFGPFGETFQFLGGTLSQLMWPALLIVYFLRRKHTLAVSFCLFWLGENLVNISKYIGDARTMALPLVGGGIHDWNFLLGKWNALHHDQTIAQASFFIGCVIMIAAIGLAIVSKPR